MSKAFHLTAAFGETNGKCDTCGEETVLVLCGPHWEVDQESSPDIDRDEEGEVVIGDELTGHYCVKCGRLTSISFNQVPQ